MKILNLYCGIGGNRKNWSNDHQVTAVEKSTEIAKIYSKYFPDDQIIVGDAHSYLEKNYQHYDFIWSSPPCVTHSRLQIAGVFNNQYKPTYFDYKLYQEIIFLKSFFKGQYLVENVVPYYELFIKPNYLFSNHFFWCNFPIDFLNYKDDHKKVLHMKKKLVSTGSQFGFDISKFKLKQRKDTIIRNTFNPYLGEFILDQATKSNIFIPNTLFDLK